MSSLILVHIILIRHGHIEKRDDICIGVLGNMYGYE